MMIMASSPIPSWQIDGETMESVRLYFLGLQNHCRWWPTAMKSKDLLLGRKAITNLDSILKSRAITLPTKVRLVKAMVSSVVMYRCESWTIKKTEHRRISAFYLSCWRRLLSPFNWKEIQTVNLKEISSEYSLEELMLRLKLQYFGHLMRRTYSLGKTLMLGKIEGGKRRGWQSMRLLDGITDLMDMSLINSGSGWQTEKPGVLQFIHWSQRVGHDWTTELK